MMKIQIALFCLVLAVLSSCVTQRRCNTKFPPTVQRDSSYIETIREVPVPIPGEDIFFDVPIDCPDQNLAVFENARLRQELRIKDRKLQSFTNIKPDTVFITVHDTKTVVKEVVVTKPVEVIPQRFKNYRNIVYLIFALAFGFAGWKIYGIFKRK